MSICSQIVMIPCNETPKQIIEICSLTQIIENCFIKMSLRQDSVGLLICCSHHTVLCLRIQIAIGPVFNFIF